MMVDDGAAMSHDTRPRAVRIHHHVRFAEEFNFGMVSTAKCECNTLRSHTRCGTRASQGTHHVKGT